MKKIGTVNKTREILEENGFFMKKKFGQNFLIDQNILSGIVSKAEINKNVNVIEIGPGIGSLTEHLLENANHVISYEIDNTLIPILTKQFAEYNNFTLINEDILKADIKSDIKKYFNNDYPVYVVANLPYYITTPIIMHLLENIPEIKRYSVMVQLEVADRIVANKGGKDYNNLTIAIGYRAKTYKAINVSRNVFMPKPNVDSAVVIFDIYDEKPYKVNNEKFFFELIRKAFANRRKTLVNNLNQGYNISKEEAVKILEEMNLSSTIRSEALSIEQFTLLSDILEKRLK
jgi:16S rRNA (adenine1518-N6/adenine1519-N6)-dimethyltransferase